MASALREGDNGAFAFDSDEEEQEVDAEESRSLGRKVRLGVSRARESIHAVRSAYLRQQVAELQESNCAAASGLPECLPMVVCLWSACGLPAVCLKTNEREWELGDWWLTRRFGVDRK